MVTAVSYRVPHTQGLPKKEKVEKENSGLSVLKIAAIAFVSITTMSYLLTREKNPALDALAETHPDIHQICAPIMAKTMAGRISNTIFRYPAFDTQACHILAPRNPQDEAWGYQALLGQSSLETIHTNLSSAPNSTQALYPHLMEGAKNGSLPIMQRAASQPKNGLENLKFLHSQESFPLDGVSEKVTPDFPHPTALAAAMGHNRTETVRYLNEQWVSMTSALPPSDESTLTYYAKRSEPKFFEFLVQEMGLSTYGQEKALCNGALAVGNFELAKHLVKEYSAPLFTSATDLQEVLTALSQSDTSISEKVKMQSWILEQAKADKVALPPLLFDPDYPDYSPIHALLSEADPQLVLPLLDILFEEQDWRGSEEILNPDTFEITTNTSYATSPQLVPTSSTNIFYRGGLELLKRAAQNSEHSYTLGRHLLDRWQQDWNKHLGPGRAKTIYAPQGGETFVDAIAPIVQDANLLQDIVSRLSRFGYAEALKDGSAETLQAVVKRGRLDLTRILVGAGFKAGDVGKDGYTSFEHALSLPFELSEDQRKELSPSDSAKWNPLQLVQTLLQKCEIDPTRKAPSGLHGLESLVDANGPHLTENLLQAMLAPYKSGKKLHLLDQKTSGQVGSLLAKMAQKRVPARVIGSFIQFLKRNNREVDRGGEYNFNALDLAFIKGDQKLVDLLTKRFGFEISLLYYRDVVTDTDDSDRFKKFPILKEQMERRKAQYSSPDSSDSSVL